MTRALLSNRNLQIIFSITLLAVMGVASLTPAFPKMIKEFGISTQQVGLLITVFTLPGIILTPVLGILADRYGRKNILLPAIFLFALAGGACSLTKSFNMLLLLRFFQGIGATSLGSLNVTLIGDIFTGKDRISAMGYNSSVLSLGTASYPAIGGALAMLGWNYPFLLPLLGLPLGIWVIFSLRNPEPENDQSLGRYLVNTVKSLNNIKVIGLLLINILVFIILYGAILTYFPILLGGKFHAAPYLIGLIMSSASLSAAVISTQVGRLTRLFPQKRLLIVAISLFGIALGIIPWMPSLWMMLVPSVLWGVAQGVNTPTLQTMLVGLAPIDYRAAFMSVNGMILRLGQTLGPLIMGALYVLWGFRGAFLGAAGVVVLMLIILITMIKVKVEQAEKSRMA